MWGFCALNLESNIYPCMCVRAQLYPSLCPHGRWPTRLLCPCDSPGENPGVGSCAFLQGIFLTQGSNISCISALAAGFFTTSPTWEAGVYFSSPTPLFIGG